MPTYLLTALRNTAAEPPGRGESDWEGALGVDEPRKANTHPYGPAVGRGR